MRREDEDAFVGFVDATSARMLRLAVLLTGSPDGAQDLLQTCYEKVLRRWPRVRAAANPEAYARQVMVNAATDAGRARSRRPERLVPFVPEAAGPDAAAASDERLRILAALAALPPQQRAVVVLRHWLDMSEHDTAQALGCGVGTVKSHNSRAVRRLRELLGDGDRQGLQA